MTDANEIREIIERHNRNLMGWYASGEIDRVAEVFAEDAWQMPPNNPPLVGREAIRAFWSESARWGKWEFKLKAQKVDVSPPLAVERGSYSLKFTAGPNAPSYMNSFEDRGNYLVEWRRESDGEWRIVCDAPVSEIPLIPSGEGEKA